MSIPQLDHPLAAPGVHRVVEPAEVRELHGILDRVGALTGEPARVGCLDDATRIDQLALLERLKAVAAAAQARITVAFDRSQRAHQRAQGVRREHLGRGIADQVALARGVAASQGSRHLGFATAMAEMPHTLGLLTRGEISEWVATLLVRETAILTVADRRAVDERLCAMTVDTETGEITPPAVLGWTPRRVEAAARALAAELDPEAAVKRAAQATRDRRVTIRPAPDTMAYVTGLLPVAQGVAAWANLKASARAIKAAGDERTETQIMADLFVERLTGQASAPAVPVEIQLVLTPDTLVGDSTRPARIGDTVVPAATARDLAAHTDAPRWLRRVFTDPETGVVTHVDSRRRLFSPEDARFLDLRDQRCRHPRCDGAIADHDHVRRFTDGGATTRANGQGLCEAHHLVKELPGWRSSVSDPRPGRHTVSITTPTGHTYRSHAPPSLPQPP